MSLLRRQVFWMRAARFSPEEPRYGMLAGMGGSRYRDDPARSSGTVTAGRPTASRASVVS
jgi:hypothetical protein